MYIDIMKKLEKYIDDRLTWLSELSITEVEHCDVKDFDLDIIDYLKSVNRFDYKGICVYYVDYNNQIYIENHN